MRILLICILAITMQAMAATPQAAPAATTEAPIASLSPDLDVDKVKVKQGEFIYATVKNSQSEPKLWYGGIEYKMFKVEKDGQSFYRAILPVENLCKPGGYAVLAKVGESWQERIDIKVDDNKKPVSKIWLDPSKSDLEATDKELKAVYNSLHTISTNKMWDGKFVYPSKAPKSSPFGVKRSYNGGPVDSYHKGLDFAANTGAPVLAPAPGKVLMCGYEKDGFVVHGNSVVMDHGQGITTIYMHLNKIDVKEGDILKTGDKIGEVGHTGISTGPHLHWGLYLYGTSTDPEGLVSKELD